MGDLRERLVASEAFDAWAGTDGIVDAAIAVVAQWLRDEAAVRTKMAQAEDIATVRTLLLVKADTLIYLATSLTHTEENRRAIDIEETS